MSSMLRHRAKERSQLYRVDVVLQNVDGCRISMIVGFGAFKFDHGEGSRVHRCAQMCTVYICFGSRAQVSRAAHRSSL